MPPMIKGYPGSSLWRSKPWPTLKGNVLGGAAETGGAPSTAVLTAATTDGKTVALRVGAEAGRTEKLGFLSEMKVRESDFLLRVTIPVGSEEAWRWVAMEGNEEEQAIAVVCGGWGWSLAALLLAQLGAKVSGMEKGETRSTL